MAINKQPLFVGTIRLTNIIFDPPVISNNTDPGSYNPQEIYQAVGTYGDIVDRITISATADANSYTLVTDKLIYVYLYNGASSIYSLYKTLAMPATTVSQTVLPPELELVFTGGLLLKNGDKIYMAASTNAATTILQGDQLSVTIEGGTYDAQ